MTRLLLIGLFACGVSFNARFTQLAQQPGTVTVRPRVTATQPGVPEVKVTVDRNSVPVGSEVTFALAPARVVSDSRYRVTLFFGDGQRQVVRQEKISHVYSQSGTYTYSVLVEPERQSTPSPTPVPPVPNVKLSVSPTSVEVNRAVSFSAQLSRRYQGLKYRFVFGDGSATGWQDDANATHSYRAANTFKAYVDIGVFSNGSVKQAGGSVRESIKVTEPPRPLNANTGNNANSNATPRLNTNGGANSNRNANVAGNTNSNGNSNANGQVNANTNSAANANSNINANANSNSSVNGNANGNANSTGAMNTNAGALDANASPAASQNPQSEATGSSTDWWKYLIIAAIILFAAYQAYSYFFAPRPTFVPHVDPGNSKVGGGKPLSIALQVDVDPNTRDGEFRVDTQGKSLIESKRIEP